MSAGRRLESVTSHDGRNTLAPPAMPCNGLGAATAPATRGVVRARVTTFIRAPRDRVAELFLDYAQWPRLFPATIAGVTLVRQDASSLSVLVEHRREGRVLNELYLCEHGVVELREYKRRFDATFVNRFDDAPTGTLYTIDAEVRVKRPYAPLAPLLGWIVRRALRRYTMEPLRLAAERDRERPQP